MIAHCPKCKQLVTLPAVHVTGARVVCPFCEEVMALDDVVSVAGETPPEMKLVVEEVAESFAATHLAAEHVVAEPDVASEFGDFAVRLEPEEDALGDVAMEEDVENLGLEEASFNIVDESSREENGDDEEVDEGIDEETSEETSEEVCEGPGDEEVPINDVDAPAGEGGAELEEELLGKGLLGDVAMEENVENLALEELRFDLADESSDEGAVAKESGDGDVEGEFFADEEAPLSFDTAAELGKEILDGGGTLNDARVAGDTESGDEGDDEDIESWLTDEEGSPFEALSEGDHVAESLEAESWENVEELDDTLPSESGDTQDEDGNSKASAKFEDDVDFEDSLELEDEAEVAGDAVIGEAAAAVGKVTSEAMGSDRSGSGGVVTRPASEFVVKTPPRKSRIGLVTKLVIAGLVACLVVQLVLWWLPGSLKQDPLGLARALPGFASFLAPAELRRDRTVALRPPHSPAGVEENRFSDEGVRDELATEDEAVPPAPGPGDVMPADELAGGELDDGAVPPGPAVANATAAEAAESGGDLSVDPPDSSALLEPSTAERAKPSGVVDERSESDAAHRDSAFEFDSPDDKTMEGLLEEPRDESLTAAREAARVKPQVTPLDEAADPLAADMNTDKADTSSEDTFGGLFDDDPIAPPSTATEPAMGSRRIVNAPRITAQDLSDSMATARTAFEKMASATETDARSAMIDYYVALCRLGRNAALATRDTETMRVVAEIATFMDTAGKDQRTATVILRSAAPWFSQDAVRRKFGTEGIAIRGQVQRVAPAGDLAIAYVKQSRAQAGEVIIPVVVTPMLEGEGRLPLVEGADVFILGTVVADAAHGIVDFKGTDPTVVWSGHAVVVGQ